MISLLTFTGVMALLIAEGRALTMCILRERNRWLLLALSLPVAAFVNVLLAYTFTVLSIPLVAWTVLPAHAAILLIVCPLRKRQRNAHEMYTHPTSLRAPATIAFATVLLTAVGIYSLSHAVALPTFQYDSATNWTMRSEISFYDHAIAFDLNEDRGMAKPQYPVLFHMLQLTANLGQTSWNDTAANAVLELLTLCSLSATYLILRRRRSTAQSLLTIALIAGIPLLGVHLAQGYGDLNLLQYLLLSLVCVAEAADASLDGRLPGAKRWLALSAVLIVAGVWTKSEGWFFGLLPWGLIVAFHAWRQPVLRRTAFILGACSVALSVPWYILLYAKGLSLTPHGSDTTFVFHTEGVPEVLKGLFSRGSFGPLWYGLPVVTNLIMYLAWKKDVLIERRHTAALLWGWIVAVEVLFIYLCTPNIVFLMNAESFYRQMMIPGALLILGCSLCFDWKRQSGGSK